MSVQKLPLFQVVDDKGSVDLLRVADFHRRKTIASTQTPIICEINALLAILGRDLLMLKKVDTAGGDSKAKKPKGSNSVRIDVGVEGSVRKTFKTSVMRMDQSDRRQQLRKVAADIQSLVGLAEKIEANNIVLPFESKSPIGQTVQEIIKEFRIAGRVNQPMEIPVDGRNEVTMQEVRKTDFVKLRETPYKEDLSAYGAIDPHVTQNILYSEKTVDMKLLKICNIDPALMRQWAPTEEAPVKAPAAALKPVPHYSTLIKQRGRGLV